MLRFDSFSKLLSSGVRVGFVTGPTELIERIELHTQTTMLHASGLSQAVVSKLFDKWQSGGFLAHVDKVAEFYMKRRDAFVASINMHLDGLVEFQTPTAGMFVWMKFVGISEVPLSRAVEKNILMVPGSSFVPKEAPQDDKEGASPKERDGGFVRLSFSSATTDEMDVACQRLKELLQEENRRNQKG